MKVLSMMICAALLAAAAPAPKKEPPPPDWTTQVASTIVKMGKKDIVPLRVKLTINTMIVLPEEEAIVEVGAGTGEELWPVKIVGNVLYIKPTEEKIQTNLNVLTNNGHTYSFMLTEGGGIPDVKVFVEMKEDLQKTTPKTPMFVRAEEVERYRKTAQEATLTLAKTEASREKEIESLKQEFADEREKLKTRKSDDWIFDYHWTPNEKLGIQAIYRDNEKTYIRFTARELPVIYEYRDDKASLVDRKCEKGRCVIDKVIDRGYLSFGKTKLHFVRGDN